MNKYIFILTLIIIFHATGATAQNSADITARRLALAQELHRVKPVAPEIDRAIDIAAGQLPPAQQQAFAARVRRALNYKALELFSVKALADIMSLEELQAMVAYYSKTEAASAAAKMPLYQERLTPEINKMLDRALMEMRTGSAAQ